VHLDVKAAAWTRSWRSGASVLDDSSFPSTVVADLESGELCAFVREPPVTQRLYEFVLDTGDSDTAAAIATW
jgi:hypothetical protein